MFERKLSHVHFTDPISNFISLVFLESGNTYLFIYLFIYFHFIYSWLKIPQLHTKIFV